MRNAVNQNQSQSQKSEKTSNPDVTALHEDPITTVVSTSGASGELLPRDDADKLRQLEELEQRILTGATALARDLQAIKSRELWRVPKTDAGARRYESFAAYYRDRLHLDRRTVSRLLSEMLIIAEAEKLGCRQIGDIREAHVRALAYKPPKQAARILKQALEQAPISRYTGKPKLTAKTLRHLAGRDEPEPKRATTQDQPTQAARRALFSAVAAITALPSADEMTERHGPWTDDERAALRVVRDYADDLLQ